MSLCCAAISGEELCWAACLVKFPVLCCEMDPMPLVRMQLPCCWSWNRMSRFCILVISPGAIVATDQKFCSNCSALLIRLRPLPVQLSLTSKCRVLLGHSESCPRVFPWIYSQGSPSHHNGTSLQNPNYIWGSNKWLDKSFPVCSACPPALWAHKKEKV